MLALSVKDLKKTYANNVTALKGIDLEVREGDFFALLGQNGAGKSTTIGILCSLVNKTSGKVDIFGHDIDHELELAKACIGVVPQEINFNPFEKVDQVLIQQAGYYGVPRDVAGRRAEYYLKKMDLWGKHDHAVIRLSGGMKRRLMIARALMNEPRLLVLDEPTAGVDVELRQSLWHFLSELNQRGTTIILTTHYLEEAERLCKNVAIIDRGQVIESSDMKSLIRQLQTHTILFELLDPLEKTPGLSGFLPRLIDQMTLEIEVHQSQSLNELFAEFAREKIIVKSMHNKTNRLEELFVRLIATNKEKE